ncbi:hypothetical protein AKJ40_02650 [candidate division MSBL1 archaeon SCGC-AAA259M10]|uniref:Sodium:solute symporter n=1 Tax=candidate division MSBL1 archaeon SCGC-AAA259M10 TaxID=1698270 RepID=A0A133UZQ8_9EURY|nr:hypothetical protein AKJ40_02650 [candidate division MSBL1 archaeon SCGC-AAA259M10]
MRPIYVYISVAIWAIFGILIAYFARKRMGEGIPEFFIGGRNIGGFVSGMTYAATTYSAFMMVGLVGLTYASGVVALGFELTYLIFTVFLLLVFAPRFWAAGRRYGYTTPPDLLADRYENKYVGVAASGLAMVMLVPYASVQLMGSGYLFSGITGGQVPFMVGVLIMAVFSGITAYWAGFRSVSWTDAFQAITMIVTSILLLFFVFYHFFGSPTGFFETIEAEAPQLLRINWDFQKFLGLTLPWAFFALSNPQVSQRMFVSENIASLKRMIIYFSIFGFIYTVITALFGFSINVIEPGLETADNAMPVLLNRVPIILALLAFVGIFAAATSTLGSIVLTLSSLGTENIVKPIKPGISEKKRVFIGRLMILGLLVVCIGFASLKIDLIAVLSSMASGGLMVAIPAFFGAFFWKEGTAQGALWSIVIGGLLTGSLYISGYYPFGWWPPVWGIIATTIIYVTVSLLTEPPDKADRFLDYIDGEIEKHNF